MLPEAESINAYSQNTKQRRPSESSTPDWDWEMIPAPESTHEQAREMLSAIGKLTDPNSKGNKYIDRNTFVGAKLDAVPPSIAAHFPKTHPDSQVKQSFYLMHMPGKNEVVVGMVSFDQREHRDNRIYATHVNYHVIRDYGKKYRLERHVTNTEHGPHMRGRDKYKTLALVDATPPIKKAMVVLTVNGQEAVDINNLLGEELKKAETTTPPANT